MKKVSVIIPFYENIVWLETALESVLKQTYRNYEIILVNDGSSENVSELINKYKGRIKYIFKENGGPATARNYGIEIASGDYIAFLDSDDIWIKEKLEKQVEFMENTDAIWSHTSYLSFHDRKPESSRKKVDLSYFQGMVFPVCLARSPIATPCVMIKTRYLKDMPQLRFNENMRYGQDWFFWIHLAMNNPLYLLPEFLTKVRLRSNNAALRARVQLKTKAQFWEYMKSRPDLFFECRKVSRMLRVAFFISWVGQFIVDFADRNLTHNSNFLELFSKINYLIPYTIFKSVSYFTIKNIK